MKIIHEVIKNYLTDDIISKVESSDYYFEFENNGYHIKNGQNMHIYQYDQYIPHRLPSEANLKDTQEEYEYSAIMQTYEMIVSNEKAAEQYEREKTLPEQVEALQEENRMLTECILELSAIVYGE